MQKLVFRILLIIRAFGLSGIISAQNVSLTFNVDMSNETISPNGVHVAGNFQTVAGCRTDWNPGTCSLADPDNDQVYSATVNIPTGSYEYKFINGNQWGEDEIPPAECTVGATHNRQVIVMNNLNIPPVLFNSCNPVVVLLFRILYTVCAPANPKVNKNGFVIHSIILIGLQILKVSPFGLSHTPACSQIRTSRVRTS